MISGPLQVVPGEEKQSKKMFFDISKDVLVQTLLLHYIMQVVHVGELQMQKHHQKEVSKGAYGPMEQLHFQKSGVFKGILHFLNEEKQINCKTKYTTRQFTMWAFSWSLLCATWMMVSGDISCFRSSSTQRLIKEIMHSNSNSIFFTVRCFDPCSMF